MANEQPVDTVATTENDSAVPEASVDDVQASSEAPDGQVVAGPVDGESRGEELTQDQIDEEIANEVAFSWDASEYVLHHKGSGWYATFFGALAVLVLGAAFLHLWVELVAFLVMGWAIYIYARKEPRVLTYELTPKGITIDGKPYLFQYFRSFGVLKDIEWHSIDLEPTKRFSPRLTILFDTEDFDSIVSHLELHLPRTDREPEIIEKLSRFLRF
jgi:hypothetical protein